MIKIAFPSTLLSTFLRYTFCINLCRFGDFHSKYFLINVSDLTPLLKEIVCECWFIPAGYVTYWKTRCTSRKKLPGKLVPPKKMGRDWTSLSVTTFWLPDLIETCDLTLLLSKSHCESKYEIVFFSKKLVRSLICTDEISSFRFNDFIESEQFERNCKTIEAVWIQPYRQLYNNLAKVQLDIVVFPQRLS